LSFTIEFLGTGTSSGVPMIACSCHVCSSTNKKDKRLRSSVHIKTDKTSIVVDTTPDFRYQMLRSNIQHLDAILFTHSHKDHIAGLDDIKAYNFISQQPMLLYANDETAMAIKRDFYYAFAETKYPGIPELDLTIIVNDSFTVHGMPIVPINVKHLNMDVLGFRVGNFTYITDANRIDPDQLEKIRGSKVLVLNALRKEDHISHFTLQGAIDIALELAIPEVYFTHISHQLGLNDSINQELPPHIKLAYDGQIISL
jgi:phosphoribosyl 1,2-cyclic phosphate phosphodiesterase